MKLVYQTIDGNTFEKFSVAQQHELTQIENEIGKLIDEDYNVMETHPSRRKVNVLTFLCKNRNYFIELLTRLDEVHSLTEESFMEDDD